MTNYIWITTQFEGFHEYLNPPEEVSFLRNKHRHLFKIKVWVEVFHNDREVEFITFKKHINYITQNTKLNNLSCEMISDEINKQIKTLYPNRKILIEVSEDGENGSYNEY